MLIRRHHANLNFSSDHGRRLRFANSPLGAAPHNGCAGTYTRPFTIGWSVKSHLVMTGSGYDWDLVLDPFRSCLVVMENFSSFSSNRDVRLQVLEERKLQVAQSKSTGYSSPFIPMELLAS